MMMLTEKMKKKVAKMVKEKEFVTGRDEGVTDGVIVWLE